MPRLRQYRNQYKKADFVKWLDEQRLVLHKTTVREIAEWLYISEQAVYKKMRSNNFTFEDMLIIFDRLETSYEEQAKVILIP